MIIRAAVLVAFVTSFVFASVMPAVGARFAVIQDQGRPEMALLIRGPIKQGDAARFEAALDTAAAQFTDHRMRAVALHSRGGSISEAVKIASAIRARGLVTVVPEGAICASACVLVFGSGSRKIASTGSRLGVHGAADLNGNQTTGSLATTALIAKLYAGYGIPASAIGKMVVTPPDQILWLTPHEIEMFPGGFARQKFELQSVPIALSGLDADLKVYGVPHIIPEYQKAAPVPSTPPPPANTFGARPGHEPALIQRATDYSTGYHYGLSLGRSSNCTYGSTARQKGCKAGSYSREKFVNRPCRNAASNSDLLAAEIDRDICRSGQEKLRVHQSVATSIREWLNAYDDAYVQKLREGSCGNDVSPSNDGCRAGARAWSRTEARR